ncbi:hypothetical protein ACSYAD_34590, partial [Acaryochloris marina NIES-2412]|uniref:hypothetical protein n=1 Tax=Acaryochloris marina TaxID=155978 RepID=UPI0040592959
EKFSLIKFHLRTTIAVMIAFMFVSPFDKDSANLYFLRIVLCFGFSMMSHIALFWVDRIAEE